jgi:homoserine O-acetyltransferase
MEQIGCGVLLGATFILGGTGAQVNADTLQSISQGASPWGGRYNPDAKQADAWFDNYKFCDGEAIERPRIHYATLGSLHMVWQVWVNTPPGARK